MTRSPISSPNIPDKATVPAVAVATATDETLWALIQVLIKRGVIDAEELHRALQDVHGEMVSAGPISSQEDIDRVATSLALGRIMNAVEDLYAP